MPQLISGAGIIKITTTNICGSDLHMYEGRTNVEQGKILGHENMGVVAETAARDGRIGFDGYTKVLLHPAA
jgi:threonine dehydrogenase-like Zn-dependent dehydrogenase